MSEPATLTTETGIAPTPLATHLQAIHSNLALRMHAGALTPQAFSSAQQELTAATSGVAVFDLGYRTRIRITGEDRLRWLNGMVSNAIQTLPLGSGNYNFILNAQGKIQGDAYIYRATDSLLLDTERSQVERLLAHLDHFIIMDDVELHPLYDTTTGIGIAGPRAAALLDDLGLKASELDLMQWIEVTLSGSSTTLMHTYSDLLPHYELRCAPGQAPAIWDFLLGAGAEPIGIDAVEALRVLEGTPRFGVDFTDRHLAQETSQTRALNFTKGCYLGQEIVERIRSRATVHRNLRQFALQGDIPTLPADLRIASQPVAEKAPPPGQITSVAALDIVGLPSIVAIGFLRTEALERRLPLEYEGGTAVVLDHPPALPKE